MELIVNTGFHAKPALTLEEHTFLDGRFEARTS